LIELLHPDRINEPSAGITMSDHRTEGPVIPEILLGMETVGALLGWSDDSAGFRMPTVADTYVRMRVQRPQPEQ